MKKLKYMGVLFLACFISLSFAATGGAAERNTISVQGSAVTTVSPDMATVNLNMEMRDNTSEGAREKLAAKLAELRKTMLLLSIPGEDVKTTHYSLTPYTYNTKNGVKTDGFIGRTGVNVQVNSLNKLGSVIDRAVGLNAIKIQSVSFGLKNRSLIEKRLLSEAVANAQEKAQMVANAGGRGLGSLVSADIDSLGANRVVMENAMLDMAKMSAAPRTETELNPGSITVTARVGTVWGLL